MPCIQTITLLGSCDGTVCVDPVSGTIVLPGSPGGVSVVCTICYTDTPDGPVPVSICVPSGLGVWEPGDPIVVTQPIPGGGSFIFYGAFDANGNFCVQSTVRQPAPSGS